MQEILALINRKGGSGKTTTASAIISGLTAKGYKVLAVDLDGQGNLSYIMGSSNNGASSLDILLGRATAKEAIQHTPHGDIIPATPELDTAEIQIAGDNREARLKSSLEKIKGKYDLIVIDVPPAFGVLTVNSLVAASSVVIPIQADVLSLTGLQQMRGIIESAKKIINPSLVVLGLLVTRFSVRSILHKSLVDAFQNVATQMGTHLFKTKIREGIAVKEAQAQQQDIFSYAAKSNPAKDYANFIDEFLGIVEERKGSVQ